MLIVVDDGLPWLRIVVGDGQGFAQLSIATCDLGQPHDMVTFDVNLI